MATDVNLGMLSLDELRRLLGQSQGVTPSSQVGVSPYQQIMGRMPMLENPYASMSGGYNNFQGGYNPNLYSNAPRAIGQLGFGGGGGGGGSEPAAPSAWSSMTPAEQAAYTLRIQRWRPSLNWAKRLLDIQVWVLCNEQ
jgi:hypothetical protein